MSMDIDLPDAGFSVLLELLGENGSEKTLYKVEALGFIIDMLLKNMHEWINVKKG